MNALKTAEGAHLYGRRLIIELAQDEISLKDMREKAKQDVLNN